MKKTFPLQIPGRVDARVVESVKADLRKYVQRERRKPLPEGSTKWNFACRVGPAAESAGACPVSGLSSAVDEVVRAGSRTVYVEIVAQPAGNPASPDRS